MAKSKHRGLREHSHGKDLFFYFFFTLSLSIIIISAFQTHNAKTGQKQTTGKSPRRRRTSDESAKKGSKLMEEKEYVVDTNLDSFFEKRETKANLVRILQRGKDVMGVFYIFCWLA